MRSGRRGAAAGAGQEGGAGREADAAGVSQSEGSESELDREDSNGAAEALEQGEVGKAKAVDGPLYAGKARQGLRRRPIALLVCFFVGLLGGFLRMDRGGSFSVRVNGGRLAGEVLGKNQSLTQLGLNGSQVNHMRRLPETPMRPRLKPLPQLIVVTPTYVRPFQANYLTRLANTLMLVPEPVLWIVVETAWQSIETATLLRKTGLMYRHLVAKKNMTNIKDRGVHQRNTALEHVEEHRLDGIVYFADDDNVYTPQLFTEIRKIRRFGTWPVGMMAQGKSKVTIEGPVCKGKKVIGWHTNEKSERLRRFHVDMCGFAFNSTILWDPARWQRPSSDPVRQLDTIEEGFQETTFIEQLVPDESKMEGLADGCSKIMVFHLHLEAPRSRPFPHVSIRSKIPVTVPLWQP